MMRRVTAICLLLIVMVGAAGAQQVTDRSLFTLTTVAMSTTSAQVLAANDLRNFVQLQNNDAAIVIYCNIGAAAVVNTGIRVNAVGGTQTFATKVPIGAINCLSVSGTPALLVVEGTR